MTQLDELKRYLELSEYVEFTDSKGRLLHSIKSEKLLVPFLAHEQLQSKFNEAVEVIKFYSNGGNLNRDIWFDEKLGYFTGKRARYFLRSLEKEK